MMILGMINDTDQNIIYIYLVEKLIIDNAIQQVMQESNNYNSIQDTLKFLEEVPYDDGKLDNIGD